MFEEGDRDEPTAVSDEYGIGTRQGEYVPGCVPSMRQSNKAVCPLPAWRREAGRQKAFIAPDFTTSGALGPTLQLRRLGLYFAR